MNPPVSPATWEFEAADPEVGFLSDTLTHTCEQNVDADTFDVEAAVVEKVNRWTPPDGKVVREQTFWVCPKCGATTTSVDDFPVWMFQEPGR